MLKFFQDVLCQIKDEGIELIDFKFIDLYGKWQYLMVCIDLLEEEFFIEGFVFDGLFICGWKGIQVFDMVMVLDVNIVWVDFFYWYKILSMICLIQELCIGQFYECCFCVLVQWVLNYLFSIGLVDMVFFGFEFEFFFFDDVCYNLVEGGFFYSVDMIEVGWNIGCIEEGGNFVYKIQEKEGYFFVVFNDIVQDICFEMFLLMG